MRRHLYTCLLFCLLPVWAFAQPHDTIPAELDAQNSHYLRIQYDNDFFNATDRYYTQGIGLAYIAPSLKKLPLSHALIPLAHDAQNYYGLSAEQDCFTPSSIRHQDVFFGERPFAGTLVLSHELVSISSRKKRRLNTMLSLGMVGACAGCEQEQKTIHRWLANIQPLGWQYQVAGDAVINYNAQLEQGLLLSRYAELIGYTGTRIGTLYDDAHMGALLRIGWMSSYFEHLGIVKHAKNHRFQCYFTGRAQAKAVAYNATMQGGIFNRSSIYTIPASHISRIVLMGSAGIVIAYRRVSLEYTKVYISPEFTTGLYHGWGHIGISLCF